MYNENLNPFNSSKTNFNIMSFVPSTNFRVLSNIPLDNTYTDTLTFDTLTSQFLYFSEKTKFNFSNFTYQRINNSVRIPTNAENCFDCNYIMFQNSNFGSKWFYGFISNINYLNPETTEIIYEIDVFQTWQFNYNLGQCFIEREHVINDSIGANTIPESFELGGYVSTSESQLAVRLEMLHVYMLATENVPGVMNPPGILGNLPISAFWLNIGPVSAQSTADNINGFVQVFAEAGKVDSIISFFVAPDDFVSGEFYKTQYLSCANRILDGGYIPANNKLYTFPYCALSILGSGHGIELHYEKFSNTPTLEITSGFGANMQIMAIPLNYQGEKYCRSHIVCVSGFPVLPWVKEYFQNWLAQNKASIAVGAISDSIKVGTGIAQMATTAGLVGSGNVLNGVESIAQSLASIYEHSIIPNQMIGNAVAQDIKVLSGHTGIFTYCRSIRREYLILIDEFFTRFGYKVNRTKIPNIKSRTNFNYIKTGIVNITGNIPVNHMVIIKNAFQRGITFWHNQVIGNYEIENKIKENVYE